MPQLRSGRHFAVYSPWLEGLTTGPDEQKFAHMALFRLHVPSAQRLREHLLVLYFREGEGTPPDAPRYSSGFYVKDVLEGKAGWSEEELAELRDWVAHDARLAAWTETEYAQIQAAIMADPLWQSDLILGD